MPVHSSTKSMTSPVLDCVYPVEYSGGVAADFGGPIRRKLFPKPNRHLIIPKFSIVIQTQILNDPDEV